MDDEVIHVRYVRGSARAIKRCADQAGVTPADISGRSLMWYRRINEAQWDGGEIQVHYRDGRPPRVLRHSSDPPKLTSRRQDFATFLLDRPVLAPCLAALLWGAMIGAAAQLWMIVTDTRVVSDSAASEIFLKANLIMTLVLTIALYGIKRHDYAKPK